MLSAIFDVNLNLFDIFALIAAILFVVAGVAALPPREGRTFNGLATTIAWFGAAIFAFGFLFMTP